MGCYVLIYSAFAHSFKSTSEKYKTRRNSKLLSVTYSETSAKSESRAYVESGLREAKACESCDSVPWIPIMKFSQKSPKNIIYQEKPHYGGANDNSYQGPQTYVLPSQYQQNIQLQHNYQSPHTSLYHKDSITQQSEVKPIITSCDLLKHNHDSQGSGSEAMSTVEHYQDHGMYNYKGQNLIPDNFFGYYSYIKHSDNQQRQNTVSNFTNPPPRKHNEHRIPNEQIKPQYHKNRKDLFLNTHEFNKGIGYYDQHIGPETNHQKDTGAYHFRPQHHFSHPTLPNLHFETQDPFINEWESYKIPTVLPNRGEEYKSVHYPVKFVKEADINKFRVPRVKENGFKHNAQEEKKTIHGAHLDSDVPMPYLTPPRLQSGSRKSKKYEHHTVSDHMVNTKSHQPTEKRQHFIQKDIDNQEISLPNQLLSVDDKVAQLQIPSHTNLDQSQLHYHQNKLKTLSAIEWQCFLVNFIKYLRMSKARHTVKMSYECDPIILHHFMTSLANNDQAHYNGEVLTNEIQSGEKNYTKLNKHAKQYIDDENEIVNYEGYQQEIKNYITNEHELVKLAPHLRGEYHGDTEYVKNYSKVEQDVVNHFIRQNEISNDIPQNNTTSVLMEPVSIQEQSPRNVDGTDSGHQKPIKYDDNVHNTNIIDDINNLSDIEHIHINVSDVLNFNGSFVSSGTTQTEHSLKNQEIIDNNMFQHMLEAYTTASVAPGDSNIISSPLHEGESYTKNANTFTIEKSNNNEISAPSATFYPKGFSFTNDQTDFITEKPILLTAPKKIKIVIPYRKRSDEFQNSIDTLTADGYSNHKLSYDKFNTISYNRLQKSKSIPLLYLNSTQANNSGSDQSNATGNVPKTWEDLIVAISPYTKERVYIVTPKSN